MTCPICHQRNVTAGHILGHSKSADKSAASRANGKKGGRPRRKVARPHCFLRRTKRGPDPVSPYELKCLRSVDFDDLLSGERTELDGEEIWRNADNLFYPRPQDEQT